MRLRGWFEKYMYSEEHAQVTEKIEPSQRLGFTFFCLSEKKRHIAMAVFRERTRKPIN